MFWLEWNAFVLGITYRNVYDIRCRYWPDLLDKWIDSYCSREWRSEQNFHFSIQLKTHTGHFDTRNAMPLFSISLVYIVHCTKSILNNFRISINIFIDCTHEKYTTGCTYSEQTIEIKLKMHDFDKTNEQSANNCNTIFNWKKCLWWW